MLPHRQGNRYRARRYARVRGARGGRTALVRWCGGHVVARRHRVRLAHGGHARSLWKSALKYRRITQQDFGFDCFEWDSVSNAGREFVMSCLAYKPIHRLTAANCLKHEWLRKVEDVRPSPLRIKSKLRDFAKGMKLPLKRYAPGDVLIRQGERATDDVFLIKSGAVRIMVSPTDSEGNVLRDEAKQVAKREPGEFIGEMALGDQLIAKSKSSVRKVIEDRVKTILARGPPGVRDAGKCRSTLGSRRESALKNGSAVDATPTSSRTPKPRVSSWVDARWRGRSPRIPTSVKSFKEHDAASPRARAVESFKQRLSAIATSRRVTNERLPKG